MSGYIWGEVLNERQRQEQKWGEQNHPSVDPRRDYEIPSESAAKVICDEVIANGGRLTWADIAIEELAEVIDAADDVERRGELIQLEAVIHAWIECIDRRASRGPDLYS